MTVANSYPEDLLVSVKEQRATAAQRVKALKTETEEATRIEKLLEDLDCFMNKGWFLHILDLIDKEAPLLDKMEADNRITASSREKIYQITKEKIGELKPYFFPRYLEEACRDANLPLDKDSTHPHYKFEKGFFQLNIDEIKKTARLSDYESRRLCELPADIGAIVEVVQREHKRVFERPFDGRSFVKKLRSHYLAILKKDKLKDGSSISIRQITRRLGKNEKNFRSDEFLIDLSRLVEQGITEIEGKRLELQQSKDISQGMLLHGAAGRGYVGFILFK